MMHGTNGAGVFPSYLARFSSARFFVTSLMKSSANFIGFLSNSSKCPPSFSGLVVQSYSIALLALVVTEVTEMSVSLELVI